ncbi:hypothetical protein CSQ89_01080 [Chitinimonas sp. BJB300]|nr:hypothetical protein CSQ89_01080 [Chitinimonas sp. BJB300]TSJ85299.1 hypothetical protein FG002_017965 [Chitinimonas sp. BJB300]
MFERHRTDIEMVAALLRAGNYDEYGNGICSQIGTRYDGEFNTWLDSVSNSGTFAGAAYGSDKKTMPRVDGNERPVPTTPTPVPTPTRKVFDI